MNGIHYKLNKNGHVSWTDDEGRNWYYAPKGYIRVADDSAKDYSVDGAVISYTSSVNLNTTNFPIPTYSAVNTEYNASIQNLLAFAMFYPGSLSNFSSDFYIDDITITMLVNRDNSSVYAQGLLESTDGLRLSGRILGTPKFPQS